MLARAREKGLDPADLAALGREHDAASTSPPGASSSSTSTSSTTSSAIDYADLIRRAVHRAEEHRDELRARYRHVFVDEYQDTDPSQVALLRALAGDGRDLVVVGDPDQSIYGFRGADVRGILDFPSAFPQRRRQPAPRGRARHHPAVRLAAAARLAARSPPRSARRGDIARADWALPSRREPAPTDVGRAGCEVLTFDTARAETEHLADLLRRAHLEDGVAWSEMAVLVRSGRSSHPRRCGARWRLPACRSRSPATTRRWCREPAVLPLLAALRAVRRRRRRRPHRPGYVALDRVEELLHLAARRPRRHRRPGARPARCAPARRRVPRTPDDPRRPASCSARAVLDPGRARRRRGRRRRRGAPAGRPAAPGARELLDDGGTAEEVLWVLWTAPTGAARLRAATRSAARRPGSPTATSTRCVRCSRRPPGPRSSAATPACRRSSTRCAARRSRPTPWPTAGCAATPSGC